MSLSIFLIMRRISATYNSNGKQQNLRIYLKGFNIDVYENFFTYCIFFGIIIIKSFQIRESDFRAVYVVSFNLKSFLIPLRVNISSIVSYAFVKSTI